MNSGDAKAPQSDFLYDPKHAKLSVTQTRAHEKERDLYRQDSSLLGNHSPSLPPRRFFVNGAHYACSLHAAPFTTLRSLLPRCRLRGSTQPK